MTLHILSSESLGNGYILENDDESLLIEAGVRLIEVKKAMNFDLSKMVGVIVSHAHL